jgi:MoaA/NifB/PqqE/SkfB family radical SAM enzyme
MLLDGETAAAIATSGLGELKVSIDGGSAEDVEYLRSGASMERILGNVARFTSMGSGVRASFYSVLNRRNAGSAHLLPAVAAGVGVRHVTFVETVPFRDESSEREIYDRREYQFASLPAETRRATLAAIRRAALDAGVEVNLELKWFRKRCFDPFFKMYVDYRGNVTPCCRIHNEVFVGNILEEGLEGSWYGRAMMIWRRDLLSRRRHRRICVERCNLGIGAEHGIDV